MFIVYDILFLFFAIIYLPALIFKQKWHKLFSVRFGILSKDLQAALAQKDNIWIHAVSVGEVLAIGRLITELKKEFPSYRLVISTVTQTGYHLALSRVSPEDIVIYAPLDFSFIVRKLIRFIRPRLYIVAETEIWPNLFTHLSKRNIPIVLINGRISDRAFGRYRVIRFLTRGVLSTVKSFCMQSPLDAQRIIDLGAQRSSVKTVGNMKFDDLFNAGLLTRQSLGYQNYDLILIGGSTHDGEEEILLQIYALLRKEFSHLRLILAPRHVDRTDEIISLIQLHEFLPRCLSHRSAEQMRANEILIVDTIGQLKSLYGIADLVFVGKSLTKRGGQNIIEPAYFAKPILIGPFMDNFRDITDLFLREKAVVQVKDEAELMREMKRLLTDSERRTQLGMAAERVVDHYRGATQKTLEVIAGFLR